MAELGAKYKYFEMILKRNTGLTKVYDIVGNRNDYILGRIKWYGPFRQYCLFAISGIVFNTTHLKDIQHFIKQLAEERKL